jgi:hypothetical protein
MLPHQLLERILSGFDRHTEGYGPGERVVSAVRQLEADGYAPTPSNRTLEM